MVAHLKIEFSKQGYESCVLARGMSVAGDRLIENRWLDLESGLIPDRPPQNLSFGFQGAKATPALGGGLVKP